MFRQTDLSRVLLSLIIHLGWNEVVFINNHTRGAEVLDAMHEVGILTSSLDIQTVFRYPWPQRNGLQKRFDGFIFLSHSTENIVSLVPKLKVAPRDVIAPRFSWIFANDGPLCLQCIQGVLTEGDKVAIILEQKDIWNSADDIFLTSKTENRTEETGRSTAMIIFQIWSLFSLGDGTTHFKAHGNWTPEDGLITEPGMLYNSSFPNFQNRILKISVLGSSPIVEPPLGNQTRWRGYMFRIINTLADLLNFSYTVKKADDLAYGIQQDDGTWSGMIGELTRKSVDMGVGDLSWSPDRNAVVDFPAPVFPEIVTFIYKAPGFYSRAWILFENIDKKVWMSCVLSFVIVGLVFFVTLIHEQVVIHHQTDVKSACEVTVGCFYRIFVRQGSSDLPVTLSCRTLLGIWFLGCLVLTALYSGTLTSRLSMHKSPQPANSLDQLITRYPSAILAIRNNTLPHAYFRESPVYKHLWESNIRHNIIPGKVKIVDILKKVKNSSMMYVWIAERTMLEKKMRESSDSQDICELYVAKEEIVKSDWALALTFDSPFLQQFNEKIVRMRNFGLVERWRSIHWKIRNSTCRPSDGLNQMERAAMSMTDTQSVFVVLILGYIASFVTLAGEILTDVDWKKHLHHVLLKRSIKAHVN